MRKSTLIKALALLLSFAMLMTGLPAPSIAESAATATDTVVEQTEDIVIEDDPVLTEDEVISKEPELPVEEPEETPIEDAPVTEPEVPTEDSEDAVFPEEDTSFADTAGDNADADADPSEEIEEPTYNEPVIDDFPDTEQPIESMPEEDHDTPDEPVVKDDPIISDETIEDEPITENEPEDAPIVVEHPVQAAVAANGYAYLMAEQSIAVYNTPELYERTYTVHGGVLLVTDFLELDGWYIVEVQFMTATGEAVLAYAYADEFPEQPLTNGEVSAVAQITSYALVMLDYSEAFMFMVEAEPVGAVVNKVLPVEKSPSEIPEEPEIPVIPVSDNESTEGDFVLVTTNTRAFLAVDNTATNDYEGDLALGFFVNSAVVQIESIENDDLGRTWYLVRYMNGDTYADGTLKWTETDFIYVLASETEITDISDFSVTDYAFDYVPSTFSLRSTTAMNGFSLRDISVDLGNFHTGQTGLHGSSGRDGAYKQIATLAGHGKIYATPHYLEDYVVYCLEHTLPGPGERISSGGYRPTGPYIVVDLASYMNTPGYSGVMYKDSTMHAIGWILRHTVPFMELNRSDSDNRTWSRVAGQFAIREVIKQLEGEKYVRDYWQMEDFYAASDNAPAVYLEYARWLAANGLSRARMIGDIIASNKSVSIADGMTIGSVTLTTDADLIRISKAYGTVTGHTYGEDSSYYYLNSGDTITIASSAAAFSFVAESVSSPDEEASFLVGVPQKAIQKVLIPQIGLPYPMKSITLSFEVSYGTVSVTKTDAAIGMPLAGATFDLISNNTVISTATTGTDGIVVFKNVPSGSYTIRESGVPEGYILGEVFTQTVTVTAGQTSTVAFANNKSNSRIKIIKTDSLTSEKLAGASFTITRLSGPAVVSGMAIGESITLVTDANGEAETDWLEWGRYRIEETEAPQGFIPTEYTAEIDAYENGKVYTIDVQNEPMTGFIQVEKTNSVDGHPIAGVQFNIYHNDQYSSDLAGTMTTNQNGIAISPPLRKGNYLVIEHEAPTGYVYNPVELTATVQSNETTYLTVENQPIQEQICIIKKDQLTGKALADAEFTITRISGLLSHNGESDGEVVAVITTDVNGVAVSPLLTYGTYHVEETKVPPHFVGNDFSTEMVINEANFCTYEIDVENEPTKGWLRLTKTDRENGNPIAGVVFDVYYADQYGQGLATTMVTDANGVAMSEPLRKGQYIVQERGATEGYVFEQVFLEATVHSDETTELTATNQPVLVQLKLYKRDADEYSGNSADAPGTRGDGVLTGAEFQVLAAEDITDRQGNILYQKGDVVIDSIKTTGADASITTDKLWPGLYQVVELTPPTGYQPCDKPIVVDARAAAKQSEEAVITYEGVITNDIKYGAQAIVKLLGDGTAAADPTRVETPEPGAEFRVYLQKAGSYDNARDIERDYLVTDANGYAMTKALPYGVYVLEQVKGKEGYEIKGPITFEIDGSESIVNPPPLTLSDQPILYRLKFIKTDSETGKVITLSNASFKLKDANGEYVRQTVYYPREQVIDTFTTDETGSVTLPETVTWGLYFVEELKAPEGYLIRTESLSVFVGHEGDLPGQTYELEIAIPNDPVMGKILLDKKGLQLTDVKITTDAWGNEVHTPVYEEDYLAGAVFEIRAAEDITGKDGTVWYQADELVDTITTTANGSDASKELPLGKYNVTEVSAPEGYFFTDRAYIVDLKYQDNQTALVEVRVNAQNDFLPAEISLFKEKETINIVGSGKDGVKSVLTDEAGEGFVFGLFTAEDMPYAYGTLMADTLVATGATDKNGMLTLTGTFPHGDYYIRELYAPAIWKITADRFDLSITPDRKADDENVLRVLMVDAIHNELIHSKVTLTKTDITGEKTLPGAIIEVYNESGKIIYRDTTDEMGRIANIPVTAGHYTFREVYAPDGYSLNDVTMSFTVSEDGVVTGDTTIRDDYTRFSIEKLDEADEPLAGVEFSLVAANGTAIMTVRTNREGIATFEKVPFGTYRIVEAKPLAGYLPAEMEVEVTIDGTFINPEQPIATIVNVPNEIVIRKVDQDGKPLAGAEFGLFDAFGERFAVAASDENGMVRFNKVPYGSYTIRELSAPDGYLASREEIAVTIDADYRSSDKPIATVKNHFKRVQFIKVDTSGKYLPGVEFSLINALTHEVVETAVSNDKGEFIFTKFDYGDWIVRETAAPEGYNRMEDYLLHVDENWTEPKPITLVNIPSTYMFFKSDNKKNALAGVTFVVEDENGNVVQEVVSAENGVVYIYGLTPGKYTIRETATVEGFTVSDDTITVEINEKYKVPTKLKRFINYPSISTGVDVSPTTLTWVGIGLVGIAGLIVALNSVMGVKKHPKRRRK